MEGNLYQYMADSSLLNGATLSDLEQLVASYPYFSTARMLYLKNIALLNDARFKMELQRTAIYVPDRKMLFMLIEEIKLIVENDIMRQPEEKEDTFNLIDEFLASNGNKLGDINSNPDILFPPSVSTDYTPWLLGIQQEKGENDNNQAPDLPSSIDAYIKEAEGKPRMPFDPAKDYSEAEVPTRMGDYSPTDDSYFTETLAKIYIRQRRYEKALEIINNINLKYPQKNIYFADQIRFLEKLIINAKNKV